MFGQPSNPIHTEPVVQLNAQKTIHAPEEKSATDVARQQSRFSLIQSEVMQAIEPAVVVKLSREELEQRTFEAVGDIAYQHQFPIGAIEQKKISEQLVNEMLGLGPITMFTR